MGARHATETIDQAGPTGRWSLAVRAWVLATVVAGVAASALAAQGPSRFEEIPIISGGKRDTKTEAQLLAAPVTGARALSVYRIPASIERIFRYYVGRLGAQPADPSDNQTAPVSGTTRVTYGLVFHSFADECADSAASAPAPTSEAPVCQRWRRGKDKKNSLDRSRVGYEVGTWIETATFRWLSRDPTGAIRQFRVELKDVGLSRDWKHSMPVAQLLVESLELPPGAQ